MGINDDSNNNNSNNRLTTNNNKRLLSSSQQQRSQRTTMTLPSLLLRTVVPLFAACMYMAAQFSSMARYRVEFQMRASRGRRRRRQGRGGRVARIKSRDHIHVPRQQPSQLEEELPNNTVWNNVQYYTGTFGNKHAAEWEQLVIDRCGYLSGYFYGMPNRSNICSGPLPTNTTCCYCYFSDANFLNMGRHRSWACAVERNHSLLPLNTTRVNNDANIANADADNNDGPIQVAWITGRFSHANGHERDVKQFCHDVLQKNYFDPQDAHCLWESPDYVLQNPKFQRHLLFRNDSEDVSKKGGGFWFHKSVVIRHYLDSYQDGDIIVYTDIDRFDFFDTATFHAVVDTMIQRGDDLCMEVIGIAPEFVYTKEDMLTAFNASKTIRRSGQSLANVIVFRNSPTMKLFLDAWIECMADWHMVTDEPSILPNARGYNDHRHDQSVISLLVKTFMTAESVVGPPARPYAFHCELFTYRFRDDAYPTCPFAAYYASPEYANLLLLLMANVTSNTTTTD